jgi:putative protein kinase ArgK-like GTPase of G3E family
MTQELQTSNVLEKDEQIIDAIVKDSELVAENIDAQKLLSFMQSQLQSLYHERPIIVTITGAPASGKDTMVKSLIESLSHASHSTAGMGYRRIW